MARAQLNTVLSDLDAVVDRMRAKGLVSWVGSPVGDLVLGPEVPPVRRTAKEEKDPKQERRTYYAEVLGRPVTDAELEKLP